MGGEALSESTPEVKGYTVRVDGQYDKLRSYGNLFLGLEFF
jgi:hypothetical protein